MLKLYNSMAKRKIAFKPLFDKTVGMYVCGITAYDYCHVGNARVYIVFDVLFRYLQALGYTVNYVRNITDIDDKIIQRAQNLEQHFSEVAERFTQAFREDMLNLNVLPPTHEPHATDYVVHMVDMIESLIEKGYAYVGENGDVYFDVSEFQAYGKLSAQDLSQLRAGERVAVAQSKQDPLDFVLWKMAKEGEPSWESPWGAGRPGWHIECSAMSRHCLDNHFDIHGGGVDLIFPHHENEIAQSEAATGVKFMHFWMHVGFVQVNEEKMSKSLGNFFTVREVCAKHDPEVLRYFILSSHYRSPIQYSDDNLRQARAALERFYIALRDLPSEETLANTKKIGHFKSELKAYEKKFHEALSDDLNTPIALSVLFEIVHEMNTLRETNPHKAHELATLLKKLAGLLGLLYQEPAFFLQGDPILAERITHLVAVREDARVQKDWLQADHVRAEIEALGFVLEDTPQGTTWRKKG